MKKILLLAITCIFLACTKETAQQIKVEKLAEASTSWNGDTLPNYPTEKPKVTVLKVTIPPKAKLHWHKHLVINAGVLINGILTVVDEHGNALEMKTGDALIELVNTYHYGENKGATPAEIIVVYAGAEGIPITVVKE